MVFERSGCNQANVVLFGQKSCCIRAKVVLFIEKVLVFGLE